MKRCVLLVLASCADVPDTPSFQQDVAPIFQANCMRCHGYPQIGGAPEFLRLTYASFPGLPPGAAESAMTIRERVVAREMPPRLALTDDQIAIIERWVEQGAQRGEPRQANQAPRASEPEVIGRDVVFDLRDRDGDILGGFLHDGDTLLGEIHQGRNRITLAPGSYDLTIEVDDGGELFTLELGTVTVP